MKNKLGRFETDVKGVFKGGSSFLLEDMLFGSRPFADPDATPTLYLTKLHLIRADEGVIVEDCFIATA